MKNSFIINIKTRNATKKSINDESTINFHVPIIASSSIFSAGNIETEGDIIAQNFIVSSSVTYMTQSFSSGSTIFGNTDDDTHQFTGSLLTKGAIISNGLGVISSSAMIASEISGAFTAVSKSFRDDNFVQSQSVTARLVNIEGGSIGGGSISKLPITI